VLERADAGERQHPALSTIAGGIRRVLQTRGEGTGGPRVLLGIIEERGGGLYRGKSEYKETPQRGQREREKDHKSEKTGLWSDTSANLGMK